MAVESAARAAVVTLNVAEVALAATVTDAGVVSAVLLSVIVTPAPPVGAALVSVTVQVLEAFGPMLAGVQEIEDTVTGARRFTVVLAELPL